MLTEETRQAILDLQKLYPEKRSALIPALHLAQKEKGYLPIEIQNEVAKLFDLDPNEVHSVVTFYDMFYEKPMGKKILHVCKGISCMLRGSDPIIEKLCQKLHVNPGETTSDGEYSILPCECLGACDRAPMALVDHEVVGPIDSNHLEPLLQDSHG